MYREPDFTQLQLASAPDCRFEPAPADGVLPDGFMSTTNHPTYVKVTGRWRMPERPRMDSHLVYDPGEDTLVVKEFRLIRQGDLVAVAMAENGSEGSSSGTAGSSTRSTTPRWPRPSPSWRAR